MFSEVLALPIAVNQLASYRSRICITRKASETGWSRGEQMPTGSRYTESATQMALENVLTFRSRLKELTNKHWIQIYAQLREFTLEGKVRTDS